MQNSKNEATLQSLLVKKYSKIDGLSGTQLDVLMYRQKRARWIRRTPYMSVLLLMFTLTSVLLWNEYRDKKMLEGFVLAILDHHYLQINAKDFARKKEDLAFDVVKSKFNFLDVSVLKNYTDKYKIVKYEKCNFQNHDGVQIVMKDRKTGVAYSLFQFPYNETNKNLFALGDQYRYQTDQVDVGMFIKDNIVVFSAQVLNENKS